MIYIATLTALLKITEDIRIGMQLSCATIMVLLDFSKAFDTVDHSLLLKKPQHFIRFDTSDTALISSYLSNRFQRVSIKDTLSSFSNVKSGVPQGSVLGPLLFSLIFNDLPNVLKYAKYHMFADDVEVYITSPESDLQNAIRKINIELESISLWSHSNGLLLNPAKSQSIIFSRFPIVVPSIELYSTLIPFSERVTCLGLVLNSKLTWFDNVANIVSKVYSRLRSLRLHSAITPNKLELTLLNRCYCQFSHIAI